MARLFPTSLLLGKTTQKANPPPSSPSASASHAPPPPPPETAVHAAPRRLQRTLSFRGGEDLTEALHIELERSLLQIVEDKGEGDDKNKNTHAHTQTCRFSLVKPDQQQLFALATSGREGDASTTNNHNSHSDTLSKNGPWVLGDGAYRSTFSLYPLLERLGEESRLSLLESLIDPIPTRRLEAAGKINWHPECAALVALRTESDGNCLAHAASVGCWGVHDRKLLLRNAVRSFLVEGEGEDREGENKNKIINRSGKKLVRLIRKAWEEELGKHGVNLDKEALDGMWAELATQAENTTLADGLTVSKSPTLLFATSHDGDDGPGGSFAYLEACHIYILAHVLRRPIIVLATDWTDSQGRRLAAAEEIAGVYLPLELPRLVCSRIPLVLAFDNFHFSPLVPGDPSRVARLPLCVGKKGREKDKLLPMPFYAASEHNERLRAAVLKHYLDCEVLSDGVLCVRMDDGCGGHGGGGGGADGTHTHTHTSVLSPFSAAVPPVVGLISLLRETVVEEEVEKEEAMRVALAAAAREKERERERENVNRMKRSSSAGGGMSEKGGQQQKNVGTYCAPPPLPPASSSSHLLYSQQQQQQQSQQLSKSSSCSSISSNKSTTSNSSSTFRRTTPKSTTTTTTTNNNNNNNTHTHTRLSPPLTAIARRLQEDRDLALALELFNRDEQEQERISLNMALEEATRGVTALPPISTHTPTHTHTPTASPQQGMNPHTQTHTQTHTQPPPPTPQQAQGQGGRGSPPATTGTAAAVPPPPSSAPAPARTRWW